MSKNSEDFESLGAEAWVAGILPEEAEKKLSVAVQKARALPIRSEARRNALNEAIQKIRHKWPKFFREDDKNDDKK